MASIPRSGLFGFLMLLAALAPSAGQAAPTGASGERPPTDSDSSALTGLRATPSSADAAALSVDARLRRISAALREQDPAGDGGAEAGGRPAADQRLAWVWGNGGGGFRNGGFRNGGWGNGGFRNGGWGNGGFRNGGWGNGGGFRNGGWLNVW